MKIAVFHELPYDGVRRAVIEFGRALAKYNDIAAVVMVDLYNIIP